MSPSSRCAFAALAAALVGCAPMNEALSTHPADEPFYEPKSFQPDPDNSDTMFIALALSGGGTRASSLAYGVMEELHDITVPWEGRQRSLVSEVDLLSSVSGGSFTATYYTLFRDRLFQDFKEKFLTRNIELELVMRGFISPFGCLRLPSPFFDRIDIAGELYHDTIFEKKTFSALAAQKRKPLLVLNSTNMSLGVSFEFTQELFRQIGSDLSSYPLGWAVAASSAFPYLLSPVTLENFGTAKDPQWVTDGLQTGPQARGVYLLAQGWNAMGQRDNHPYIHLLDGGLADNLGARYIARSLVVSDGWIRSLMPRAVRAPPGSTAPAPTTQPGAIQKLLIFTVNAKTAPDTSMDKWRPGPNMIDVLFRTSATAMDNYTDDTIVLVTERLQQFRENYIAQWARSHEGEKYPGSDACDADPLCGICYFPVPTMNLGMYVVNVDLDQLADPKAREAVQKVPTSFVLSKEQVELMIRTGRTLVKQNPCFQRFLSDVRGAP